MSNMRYEKKRQGWTRPALSASLKLVSSTFSIQEEEKQLKNNGSRSDEGLEDARVGGEADALPGWPVHPGPGQGPPPGP